MSESHLAKIACVACYRLKRKCTRELPSCALCKRVRRRCEYEESPATPSSRTRDSSGRTSLERSSRWHDAEPSSPQGPRLPLAQAPRDLSRSSGRFPAAWFLDSVYCRGSKMILPDAFDWDDLVQEPVSLNSSQAWNAADRYFASVQCWLPISM